MSHRLWICLHVLWVGAGYCVYMFSLAYVGTCRFNYVKNDFFLASQKCKPLPSLKNTAPCWCSLPWFHWRLETRNLRLPYPCLTNRHAWQKKRSKIGDGSCISNLKPNHDAKQQVENDFCWSCLDLLWCKLKCLNNINLIKRKYVHLENTPLWHCEFRLRVLKIYSWAVESLDDISKTTKSEERHLRNGMKNDASWTQYGHQWK